MLPHTFCHIPGIGKASELALWQAGIHRWQDWPAARLPAAIRHARAKEAQQLLAASQTALDSDPLFFTTRLSTGDSWRIFPHFREHTAYLDIETTGLSEAAEVTVLSLYDGKEVRVYISGRNLDDFLDDVGRYSVLVTYNGMAFDIPFLRRALHAHLPQAQIDLRYALARLGCRGGLKGSEKQLGIARGALDTVNGAAAVLLWREYQHHGDERLLETLLAYNIEDTVNLERLLVEAYNRNVAATPFAADLFLPYPDPPLLPYQPDPDCLAWLHRRAAYFTG